MLLIYGMHFENHCIAVEWRLGNEQCLASHSWSTDSLAVSPGHALSSHAFLSTVLLCHCPLNTGVQLHWHQFSFWDDPGFSS